MAKSGRDLDLSKLRVVFVAVLVGGVLGAGELAYAQGQPISFSAVGDVPYSTSEKAEFQQHMDKHDLYSPADFLVHLGDIKDRDSECSESWYQQMRTYLRSLSIPGFIVPGDNEWNDCTDPTQAWAYWMAHLLAVEQFACGLPVIERQEVRPENFAFVKSGVLFIGINKVSGALSSEEKNTRLQQDGDWVTTQMQTKGREVRATVIFAQATPAGEPFESQFRGAAAAFGKPVLYIHGDGHVWMHDNPFPEPNITRVQVDRGSSEHPPVLVTVTMDAASMFLLNRDPWPTGTLPLNRPPCVEAGPDQQSVLAIGAVLQGKATDDGEPIPPNLAANWTHVGGPGIVSFDNPNALGTTAHFSAEGLYELRLTVSDGEFLTADTMFVDAQINPPPVVAITAPAGGSVFDESQTVTFAASASDIEEGDLTALLTWTSSLDGAIGNGGQIAIATLSVGVHTITASVTDTGGKTSSESTTVTIVVVPPSTTVQVRVAASSDDAEEDVLTGAVSLTSGDLELVDDGGVQIVGMRFNGIAVPPGATILDARIQFQVEQTSSTATSLTIQAQAADSASTFTTAIGSLSMRSKTTAAVPWVPVAWTVVGAAGPEQRTPDLKPIIQEIVNRPGWASGNSLAVLITGTGKRVAESYNGLPGGAPLLTVEFTTLEQTPSPDIDVQPGSKNYGAVAVGSDSIQTFAIRNAGNVALDVSATALVGAQAAEFAITQGGAPFAVAPGATHNLVVRFGPTSPGAKTATLRVTSTDPNENPVNVPLSGTGGVQADIAVAPASHDYGTQATGTSVTKSFVVSNTGTGNLIVGQSTLSGTGAASFAFASGQTGFTVAPGGTGTLAVRFTPLTIGSKTATLTIPSNDPDENPLQIPLTGAGITMPVLREWRQGGSANASSVRTAANLTGASGHLYLAAVSTTPYVAVSTVSGLGVTWARVHSQCGARSQTGIDLWWAQGAATNGAVTATLTSFATHSVIAVARYSEVAAVSSIAPLVAGNTLGTNGACAGGTNSSSYSLPVTTTSPALVFGAVALRNRSHTPGSGYTERAEAVHGKAGNMVRIALVDRSVPTATSLPLNGTLNGLADWAVIGIAVRPVSTGP
ncbi:MAG TPA: choice-of-anchor D domain-containing protein [Vicinamibacterales bacterium]